MSNTLLLTSIAPPIDRKAGGIDVEKLNWTSLCIKSWSESGHEILSMNSSDEINILINIFPDINYHIAPRTTRPINNRDLVYISDIFNTGMQHPHKRLAICNSDVLISKSITKLESNDFNQFTAFSNRINIDSTESLTGDIFYGIDYLNMSKEIASKNMETLFTFGMPWWDYWYPYFSSSMNYQLIRLVNEINNPILLHKKHKDAWNPVDLCIMGKHFIDLIHNQGIISIRSNSLEEMYLEDGGQFQNSTPELYAEIAKTICSHIHKKAINISL